MTEIIKFGTKKIMKCRKCGCEFSYENEDVKQIIGTKGGARSIVTCPQCKESCEIAAER